MNDLSHAWTTLNSEKQYPRQCRLTNTHPCPGHDDVAPLLSNWLEKFGESVKKKSLNDVLDWLYRIEIVFRPAIDGLCKHIELDFEVLRLGREWLEKTLENRIVHEDNLTLDVGKLMLTTTDSLFEKLVECSGRRSRLDGARLDRVISQDMAWLSTGILPNPTEFLRKTYLEPLWTKLDRSCRANRSWIEIADVVNECEHVLDIIPVNDFKGTLSLRPTELLTPSRIGAIISAVNMHYMALEAEEYNKTDVYKSCDGVAVSARKLVEIIDSIASWLANDDKTVLIEAINGAVEQYSSRLEVIASSDCDATSHWHTALFTAEFIRDRLSRYCIVDLDVIATLETRICQRHLSRLQILSIDDTDWLSLRQYRAIIPCSRCLWAWMKYLLRIKKDVPRLFSKILRPSFESICHRFSAIKPSRTRSEHYRADVMFIVAIGREISDDIEDLLTNLESVMACTIGPLQDLCSVLKDKHEVSVTPRGYRVIDDDFYAVVENLKKILDEEVPWRDLMIIKDIDIGRRPEMRHPVFPALDEEEMKWLGVLESIVK